MTGRRVVVLDTITHTRSYRIVVHLCGSFVHSNGLVVAVSGLAMRGGGALMCLLGVPGGQLHINLGHRLAVLQRRLAVDQLRSPFRGSLLGFLAHSVNISRAPGPGRRNSKFGMTMATIGVASTRPARG
jgi:hypothetical protein